MDKPSQWSSWLAWVEYHYNTATHSSIGTSPFHAIYGRSPLPLVRYEWGSTANREVDNYLTTRDALLAELKDHLQHAQQKMQQYANKKRRAISFEVGEHVYLKLQPYKQTTLRRKWTGCLFSQSPNYCQNPQCLPCISIEESCQISSSLHFPPTHPYC